MKVSCAFFVSVYFCLLYLKTFIGSKSLGYSFFFFEDSVQGVQELIQHGSFCGQSGYKSTQMNGEFCFAGKAQKCRLA